MKIFENHCQSCKNYLIWRVSGISFQLGVHGLISVDLGVLGMKQFENHWCKCGVELKFKQATSEKACGVVLPWAVFYWFFVWTQLGDCRFTHDGFHCKEGTESIRCTSANTAHNMYSINIHFCSVSKCVSEMSEKRQTCYSGNDEGVCALVFSADRELQNCHG